MYGEFTFPPLPPWDLPTIISQLLWMLHPPYYTVKPQIGDSGSITIITVQLNEHLDMFCEIVNSVPPAEIVWYKNEERLPNQDPNYFTQSNKQVLTFSSVQTSDAGTYECRATNKAGETNKIFNVEVQGR